MPPTNHTVTRLIDTRIAGNEPSQPVMSLIKRVRRVLWSPAPAERTALVSSIDVLLPILGPKDAQSAEQREPQPGGTRGHAERQAADDVDRGRAARRSRCEHVGLPGPCGQGRVAAGEPRSEND